MKLYSNGSNLDEIVFEKRNKKYGAYFLRRRYRRTLSMALLVSISFLSLAVGTPFILANINKGNHFKINENTLAELSKLNTDFDKDIPPPPPPPPPPPILKLENQIRFRPPIVVDTVEKPDLKDFDKALDNSKDGKVDDSPKDVPMIVEVPDDVKGDEESEKVHTFVEEPPQFPGGEDALLKYVAENVKYPQEAKDNNVQGKVWVQFVINKSGKVEQVKAVRSPDILLEKEAIRVIQTLPQWTPGKMGGNPVKVSFTMPINFVLN
ncbi:MAG: energy transducer TonB [Bacteroidia bacterium]|nr:energy transducer TonB [Bacteroidia bacterium]